MLLNNYNKLILYVHTQDTTLVSVHVQFHVHMVQEWGNKDTFSFFHLTAPWLSQYPQQTCSNWLAKKDCTHALLYARHTSTHPSNKESKCQPTQTSQSKHQGRKHVPWRRRQFCCITTRQQRSQRHEKSLHQSTSRTNEKSNLGISLIWCKIFGNRLSSFFYALPLG